MAAVCLSCCWLVDLCVCCRPAGWQAQREAEREEEEIRRRQEEQRQELMRVREGRAAPVLEEEGPSPEWCAWVCAC